MKAKILAISIAVAIALIAIIVIVGVAVNIKKDEGGEACAYAVQFANGGMWNAEIAANYIGKVNYK